MNSGIFTISVIIVATCALAVSICFHPKNSFIVRTPQNWNIQSTRMQMKPVTFGFFPQPANQRSLVFK